METISQPISDLNFRLATLDAADRSLAAELVDSLGWKNRAKFLQENCNKLERKVNELQMDLASKEKALLYWIKTGLSNFIDTPSIEEFTSNLGGFEQGISRLEETIKRYEDVIAGVEIMHDKICQAHSMPDIPAFRYTAADLVRHRKRLCGIYVAIRHTTYLYVGKSNDIPARIRSHIGLKNGKFNKNDEVAVIEMPAADIHLAEIFYIWLLRPIGNGEVRQSLNAPIDEGSDE